MLCSLCFLHSRADGLSLIIRMSIVTLPDVGFVESEVSEKYGHVPVFDGIFGGFRMADWLSLTIEALMVTLSDVGSASEGTRNRPFFYAENVV